MDRPATSDTSLIHDQWTRLDAWLHKHDDIVSDAADRSSSLDGWTVGELVSHLGRAMSALAVCEPAPPGTVPLTLAEYLGTYPDRAAQITETTRALDLELAPDRRRGVERMAADAFTRLDALVTAGAGSSTVVQARRGPILLSDMVLSRLVELVVHADDLARSLPEAPGDPVDPRALDVVAEELLRIVIARGGWSIEVDDSRMWVRLATGRVAYDVDLLARAIRPVHMSDAVPDLGRMLPLL